LACVSREGRRNCRCFGRASIIDFDWEAIPVDESDPENQDMAILVASIEEDFVKGEDGTVKMKGGQLAALLLSHSCRPGD